MPVDRVHQGGDQEAVGQVGGHLRALGHGAGHDRGRGRGEHHLEEPEHRRRDVIGLVDQEEPGVADEGVALVESRKCLRAPEHEGVAEGPERQAAGREVQDVLGQVVDGVLRADEAGAQEGEAGLHEEHQGTRQQRPYERHADRRVGLQRGFARGIGLGEDHIADEHDGRERQQHGRRRANRQRPAGRVARPEKRHRCVSPFREKKGLDSVPARRRRTSPIATCRHRAPAPHLPWRHVEGARPAEIRPRSPRSGRYIGRLALLVSIRSCASVARRRRNGEVRLPNDGSIAAST